MKQAGRRDRYITINQTTYTQDSYGQPTVNLISTSNWWAEIVYKGSPKESVKASQIYPERDLVFIIQHTNPTGSGGVDVSAADTITYDGDTFEVIGVEELGRLDGLRIWAKKRGE
mgnify:CR=1 FL=1